MTNNEKELLDQLKDFFTKKYDEGSWEKEFKKYTNKLVVTFLHKPEWCR